MASDRHAKMALELYDKLGRGSVADEKAIAAALAKAERDGLRRAAVMASDYAHSNTVREFRDAILAEAGGFND